jgi:DNA modification methylase
VIEPYYDRDGITVYVADCLDVLPQLEAVDHVITDPPYEVEAHTQGRRAGSGHGAVERPLDFEGITDELRCAAGREMTRLSSGWVLVFCQVEAAMSWRDALHPARYVRTQIWRKPDGAPQFTGDRPGMGYESIVTCWAGDGRTHWNGGGRHGVYEHRVERNSSGHMTAKPLPLMRELIRLFTDPGDLILDPFAGSLTTAVAAHHLGRRCIAIEREQRYVDAGLERLRQGVLL